MNSDDIEAGQEASATGRQILAQVLIYFGVSCVGGGLAAGVAIGIEKGISVKLALVAGAFMLAGIAALAGGLKIGDFDPPSLKTKTGRSQVFMLLAIAIGVVLSMYLIISGAMDRILEGTFTPSPGEALTGGVLLAAMLVTGLYWQRQMDEHEFASVKSAGYWALSTYVYGYPAWWLAAAAGLAPAVNGAAMYAAVALMFCAVWLVKRAG